MEQKKLKDAVSPEFSRFIKRRREELGYSVQQVASAIDRSPSYISRIESRKRNNPSVCIVYRLAILLEVTFEDLVKVAFSNEYLND